MENMPFLVARRRNEQHRNGAAWALRIAGRMGIDPDQIRVLDADISVERERRKKVLVEDGIKSGAVKRTRLQSFEEAVSAWNNAVRSCPDEQLVCELLHFPDFPIVGQAHIFGAQLGALLELDGDTVTISSLSLTKGLSVDRSVGLSATEYELDQWGSW